MSNFTPEKNKHHLMEAMLIDVIVSHMLHGIVNLSPLLQVFSLSQVNSLNSSTVHFYISISYGCHGNETFLHAIYNSIVEDGQLKEGTIIKVTQCTCNVIQNASYALVSSLLFYAKWVIHPYLFYYIPPLVF